MKRISSLETHLGYWLRLISNQVSQSFARSLDAQGVTVAEWVLLRHLFGQRDAQAALLSKTTGLTKGAISKLIARLHQKGLVQRKDSKSDGRSETINLTSRGEHLVPKLAAIADQNDELFFSCLSARERSTLQTLMSKIAAAKGITGSPVD